MRHRQSNLFVIQDTREVWHKHAIAEAHAWGFEGRRIKGAAELLNMPKPELGFIRPHANPKLLRENQDSDFPVMQMECRTVIQDLEQVIVYEDKREQFNRWGALMPQTMHIMSKAQALENVAGALSYDGNFPIVSKSHCGASSHNVRIINSPAEFQIEVERAFGHGIKISHCDGGDGKAATRGVQRGYLLLQEFIPHDTTWRVNRVGDAFALFKRHNYPNKPVAQSGNTEAVTELDDAAAKILKHAAWLTDNYIKSKWVALDLLIDPRSGTPLLLETSLAWPWEPGLDGFAQRAQWFRASGAHVFDLNAEAFGAPLVWADMWRVMFSEYVGGAWSKKHVFL